MQWTTEQRSLLNLVEIFFPKKRPFLELLEYESSLVHVKSGWRPDKFSSQ